MQSVLIRNISRKAKSNQHLSTLVICRLSLPQIHIRTICGKLDPKNKFGTTSMNNNTNHHEDVKNIDQALSSEQQQAEMVEHVNKDTGELGGPRGPEPTRFGDWEKRGRISDF
eukprot:TRINITY_DN5271_c0_g1_i2.p1 TRINITY_DN5271_c0_g1~~TRINITY_DN5271_c0_g1_i2.p1  ORF type:complete len:113 (+),score=24.78 TRINITY_DN5271_c0_g1_i2:61-399(+)